MFLLAIVHVILLYNHQKNIVISNKNMLIKN